MPENDVREILSVTRGDPAERTDPILEKALQAAQTDPALATWLKEQHAFDAEIRTKIGEIRPPADLPSRIFDRIKARPRRPAIAPWLALAAVLAAGFFLVPGWLQQSDFRAYESKIVAMVTEAPAPRLDFKTDRLEDTRRYLAEHRAPYADVPLKMRSLPTSGCRMFTWNRSEGSLTCFQLPSGELLHLVVIAKSAVPGVNPPENYREMNGWHLRFTETSDQLLFWASRAALPEMRDYVTQL